LGPAGGSAAVLAVFFADGQVEAQVAALADVEGDYQHRDLTVHAHCYVQLAQFAECKVARFLIDIIVNMGLQCKDHFIIIIDNIDPTYIISHFTLH